MTEISQEYTKAALEALLPLQNVLEDLLVFEERYIETTKYLEDLTERFEEYISSSEKNFRIIQENFLKYDECVKELQEKVYGYRPSEQGDDVGGSSAEQSPAAAGGEDIPVASGSGEAATSDQQ